MDATNKKIWILDDDKSIRWVLQKALEKYNYNVTAFEVPIELTCRHQKSKFFY